MNLDDVRTVADLIEYLQEQPQDWLVYDLEGLSIVDPAGLREGWL